MAAPEPDAPRRPARLRRERVQLLGRPAAGERPSRPTARPSITVFRESFDKAKNDGERWRWALAQAAEADPGLLNETRLTLADFLLGQFGTQTIAEYAVRRRADDGRPGAAGPLCPRHPQGRRDDRPAGHRHQAVHAARRVQPDQDLPGDRRRSQDRPWRRGPRQLWRRSSRTAASSTGRPAT